MSFSSFIIIGNLLFILFNFGETIVCPTTYNSILNGCYKMNNGTNATWTVARQSCLNDTNTIITNKTGYTTHLVAFESAIETTSLIYWMKAWGIQSQFWIDGEASSSTWNWSSQSITWYFNSSDQVIYGNGTNNLIFYDSVQNTYKVSDDMASKMLSFICEYQDRCDTNNSCQNNATCYLNVGRELCICAPGYTGSICDQTIDECLTSPCQHGGTCTDSVNNYTCDCSNIFFNGPNCEIPNDDPTQGQRSAAFWSVFGVVCGLVALLTLSDLPWDEIAATIGCPWYRFKCCSNHDDIDDDDDIHVNNFRSADSPTSENNPGSKQMPMLDPSSRGNNYHIMNTVWNPEQLRNESPTNPHYNGYRSPDQHTTPNNVLIQSFAAVVMQKQKEKELEEKRVYAVDIVEQEKSTLKTKTPVETMVSWTQQLQQQLKNKEGRPTSQTSTNELIKSEIFNED